MKKFGGDLQVRTVMCLFLITFLTFTLIPMAFAAAIPIETSIRQQSLDMAKEKSEVEQAINVSKTDPKEFLVNKKDVLGREELVDIKNPNELEYSDAYKVVSANRNIIQALLDGTNLPAVLHTAPYHWEVPVLFKEEATKKPVASFTVAKSDNGWQVVEIGGYLSPEQSYFSSASEGLITFFKENSLKDANSFIHFRIPSLHTDFLYVAADEQEYFVPLIHNRDELHGLKNNTIYTRNELVSAIGPTIKRNLDNPNPAPSGYPSVERNKDHLFLVAFLSMAFIIIAFYGYRKFITKRCAP